MIIHFSPEVTQEFIFSKLRDEDIFERYGVHVQRGSFCSPLRADRKPTCNFYRGPSGRLYYRDWGKEEHHFDSIGLVRFQTGDNYHQALRRIADDFDLVRRVEGEGKIGFKGSQATVQLNQDCEQVDRAIEPPRIRVKVRGWEPRDYAFWGRWNFTSSTLTFFNVYPLKQAWLNRRCVFLDQRKSRPSFVYALNGQEHKYKLYFPYSTKRRFLHAHGDLLQGESQLTTSLRSGRVSNDYLVITKSLKDVMKLYEFKVPSVAPMGETSPLSKDNYDRLARHFKKIYSLYDLDDAGITGMKRLRDEYNIQPLWIPRDYNVKDFTDLYEDFGSSIAFKLIQTFKSEYNV